MTKLLIIAGLLLAGCQTTQHAPVNCSWAKEVLPIHPSRKDKLTRGTSEQIVAANEAVEKNCR